MRIVGLITEYNPFHNGHRHHLRESLRLTSADASVAVMSGHFLQRGEPALVDKWLRTEMALAAGVDLVLELPFAFACNSAPHFAMGAVQSLNALGVVDALCFGSETGQIEPLQRIADLLVSRGEDIAIATAQRLRQGMNYPTARAEVLAELDPQLSPELVATPNNILGIEYLRALQTSASPIEAYTLPRLGAGYHSTEVTAEIASATGIRKRLEEKTEVQKLIPDQSYALLAEAMRAGRGLDTEKLFTLLQGKMLQEAESLRGIYQVDDGLERRLTDAALTAENYAGLIAAIKSRHWTMTRIQRILSYVLLQVKAAEMRKFLASGPLYLRLLGATERGQQILAEARAQRTVPMITDPARAKAILRRAYRDQPGVASLAEQMLACDLRATRLYSLLQVTPVTGHRNQDFFQSVRGA